MTMSDSVQEFMISTPGLSPKKIINSNVANGFYVREQKEIFQSSPLKKDRNKVSRPRKRDPTGAYNGNRVNRVREGVRILFFVNFIVNVLKKFLPNFSSEISSFPFREKGKHCRKEFHLKCFSPEEKSSTKLLVNDRDPLRAVMLNVSTELSPLDPSLVSVCDVSPLKPLLCQVTENIVRGAIPVLDHRRQAGYSQLETQKLVFHFTPKIISRISTIRSAALCLVLNCLCPGSGTLLSGLLVLSCCSASSSLGCPRWGETADTFDRLCCLLVNLIISLAQLVSVPLCLVGWCWSIGWGVTILNISSQSH